MENDKYLGDPTPQFKGKNLLNKLRDFILFGDRFVVVGSAIILLLLIGSLIHYIASKQQLDTSAYNTEVPAGAVTPSPVVMDNSAQPSPDYVTNNPPTDNSSTTVTPTPTPTPATTPTPTPTPCTASSAADSSHSTFSANPSTLNGDGSTQTTITITIKDSCGNPLANANVSLSTSASGANFQEASSGSHITNSSGVATFKMTSTSGGTDQINVLSQLNGTSVTLSNLGSVTFNAVLTPTPTSTATQSATPTP